MLGIDLKIIATINQSVNFLSEALIRYRTNCTYIGPCNSQNAYHPHYFSKLHIDLVVTAK